jgi:hypothetical protein
LLNDGGSSSDVPGLVTFKDKLQHNVRLCSCGGSHTLLLDDDNALWSFGSNDAGQLGTGDRKNRYLPYLVHSLLGKDVVDMSTGKRHSGVVCENGAVYMFGAGQQGQLGINSKGKKHPSAHGKKRKMIKERKNLLISSSSSENKNGIQKFHCEDHLLPTLNVYLTLLRVVQISCGGSHTLVTTLDQKISNSENKSNITKTSLLAKIQKRGDIDQMMLTKTDTSKTTSIQKSQHFSGLVPGVLNEKNGTRISKRGKKKRARNRSQTHHEKLRDRNNKSSMVKEWLENRNKKAIDRDEFYKYKNIQFHRINTYKKFDLRNFVQELFNSIDPENDGRIRIEILSKAIQYSNELVKILKTRNEFSSLCNLKYDTLSSLDQIDLDRDGWLTVTELLHFANQHKNDSIKINQTEENKKEEKGEREKNDTTNDTIEGKNGLQKQSGTKSQEIVRHKINGSQLEKDDLIRIANKAERKQEKIMMKRKNRQRPASASKQYQIRRERWKVLTLKQNKWRKKKKREKFNLAPSPYSQYTINNERGAEFLKMKEMFSISYTKSMIKEKESE